MKYSINVLIKQIAVYLSAISLAHAQSYPSAPVRIIVPLANGGSTDLTARALASALASHWNQAVTVENVPGGEPFGINGTEAAKKATADGLTMLMTNLDVHVLMPTTQSRLSYDTVRDFTPVSVVASSPQILATASASKMLSVEDLISRAKSNSLGFVSGGSRGPQSWAGFLFKSATGLNIVHVPQLGGPAPALRALLSGGADIVFLDYAIAGPQSRVGRLNLLAIAGPSRHPKLPDVPTLREAGINGVEVDNWIGLLTPTGVPDAIVRSIHDAVSTVLTSTAVRNSLSKMEYIPRGSTPDEFIQQLAGERARWGQVYRDLYDRK